MNKVHSIPYCTAERIPVRFFFLIKYYKSNLIFFFKLKMLLIIIIIIIKYCDSQKSLIKMLIPKIFIVYDCFFNDIYSKVFKVKV